MPRITDFSDDFNRGNGDLGSNYELTSTVTNALTIDTNHIQGTVIADGGNFQKLTAQTQAVQQWASGSVVFSGSNAEYAIITLRTSQTSPSEPDFYECTAADHDGASRTCVINKTIANVVTELASVTTPTWAANDVICGEIEIVPGPTNRIRLYRNDVLILDTTDSSITAIGRQGIGIYLDSGSLGDVQFDNFIAGHMASWFLLS